MRGASPRARPVAALRPDRFPCLVPSRPGARTQGLRVPGDTAQLAPRLQPSSRARSRPALRLLAPEPLCPAAWTRRGSAPRRRGSREESLPLRRPVRGDAEPFFLFSAWSRASASEVRSVRPQSRTRAGTGGLAAPLASAPFPARGAPGPSRAPTLAAVASRQVTRRWPRGGLGPRRRHPWGARPGDAPGPLPHLPALAVWRTRQTFALL